MVNGMADGEPRESGGEGIGVCPEHFVPWVLTPVMGEFGVIVEGGCHFFFSDHGPLLKGGGDVGGEYPCKRVILARMSACSFPIMPAWDFTLKEWMGDGGLIKHWNSI